MVLGALAEDMKYRWKGNIFRIWSGAEVYRGEGQIGKKYGGRGFSSMDRFKDEANVHIHADFRFIETGFRSQKDVIRTLPEWTDSYRDLKRQRHFADRILLRSLETNAKFPYISMAFFDVTPLYSSETKESLVSHQTESLQFQTDPCRRECTSTRYGLYEEEETIGREGTSVLPKRPSSVNTIYYVMAFKTQGNTKRLAVTWRSWTGAEFMLWRCPKELCLKRVSFYRHLLPNTDDVMFILLSECSEGLRNQQAALLFLDRLRDRRCGQVGIYKIDR